MCKAEDRYQSPICPSHPNTPCISWFWTSVMGTHLVSLGKKIEGNIILRSLGSFRDERGASTAGSDKLRQVRSILANAQRSVTFTAPSQVRLPLLSYFTTGPPWHTNPIPRLFPKDCSCSMALPSLFSTTDAEEARGNWLT